MADKLTDDPLVIADRIYTLLQAARVTLGFPELGVWFGDQELVPQTPAICVEPGTLNADLEGVPDRTFNRIECYLLIYHSKVLIDTQQNARRETLQFAGTVRRWLHDNHLQLLDANGDRLVIHGFVTFFDPGYAYKRRTLYNAVQMTWTGITKTNLRQI